MTESLWVLAVCGSGVVDLVREKDRALGHLRQRIADLDTKAGNPTIHILCLSLHTSTSCKMSDLTRCEMESRQGQVWQGRTIRRREKDNVGHQDQVGAREVGGKAKAEEGDISHGYAASGLAGVFIMR
jgi:hypothetical protein